MEVDDLTEEVLAFLDHDEAGEFSEIQDAARMKRITEKRRTALKRFTAKRRPALVNAQRAKRQRIAADGPSADVPDGAPPAADAPAPAAAPVPLTGRQLAARRGAAHRARIAAAGPPLQHEPNPPEDDPPLGGVPTPPASPAGSPTPPGSPARRVRELDGELKSSEYRWGPFLSRFVSSGPLVCLLAILSETFLIIDQTIGVES